MLTDKFISRVPKDDITKQAGTLSMLIYTGCFPACLPPYLGRYYSGCKFKPLLFFSRPKFGVVFFDIQSYIDTLESGWQDYRQNGEKMAGLVGFRAAEKRSEELYDRFLKTDLSGLSLEELNQWNIEAFDLFADALAATVFTEPLDQEFISRHFRQLGSQENDLKGFVATCSLPTFESFALRNSEMILNGNPQDRSLKQILADYWITPDDQMATDKITAIIEQKGGVGNIKEEMGAMRKELKQNRLKIEEYRQRLDGDLLKLFDFSQMGMRIRDVRKAAYNRLITIASDITREIFQRQNIDPELAPYAFYGDFTDGNCLKDGYKEEIVRRAEVGTTLYVDEHGYQLEYGETETKEQKIYDYIDTDKAAAFKEIKGNSASKGVVTASVQIIMGASDFGRFKEGSVLITSMTRPEFVPLMEKAAAIITDEGGITCHAAIVSRELGKPCVIGTKNATRLLKDGDRVEVDADKGIIRKIG